ncbi:MAG: heparinase II/III family protein [Chloroflexota bacterium]
MFACLFAIKISPARAVTSELHPRLFFYTEDIPKIKEELATTHAEIWASILSYVDSQLGTAPPLTLPADTLGNTFRDYGNQLIPIAFVCGITGEENYCDLARTYLLTYSRWPQWDESNRRDLGLAHMLTASALAYDWTYPYLNDEDRTVAHASIALWAQRMYEASSQPYNDAWTNWWSSSYMQNHHWTNNSALGLAGLALLSDVDALASVGGDCSISPVRDVNLRLQASINAPAVGVLRAEQTMSVIGQLIGSDGWTWLHTENDLWVRSDVVTRIGNCDQLSSGEEMNPQVWINQAATELSRVRSLLEGIGDGTWHEGIQYQNYGLTMMLPFLFNLRRLEGVNLYPNTYLENYPQWRIYNYMPGTQESILSYGDFETWWGNSYGAQNILRFIAASYKDGQAEWLAQQIVSQDGRGAASTPWEVLEFLYYDPSVIVQPPNELPLSKEFPDSNQLIWRTGWEQNDLIFGLTNSPFGGRFGFDTFTQGFFPWDPPCAKTGCNFNIGHDHADANTFYLARGGQWLVPETSGVGKYDTSFHNTMLVDGQGQVQPIVNDYPVPSAFVGTAGSLKTSASTANFDFAVSDATARYKNIGDLQDFTRSVIFVKPDYLVMFDHLAANAPHRYEWISHFAGEVTVDGRWIRGNTDQGQVLGVNMISPTSVHTDIGDDGRPYVRIEPLEAQSETRFINLLYPTDTAGWDMKPTIEILNMTDEDTTLRVTKADKSYDDILFSNVPPDTFHDSGIYAYDAQIAVLRHQADNTLTGLFVYGGTFLTDQKLGLTYVSNLNGTQAFEADYNRGTVFVTGNIISTVTLYAPDIQHVLVNGELVAFTHVGDNITFGPVQ